MDKYLVIGIIIVVVIVVFSFWIIHYPKRRLTKLQEEHIMKYGLIHFTNIDAARDILNNKTIRPDPQRSMSPFERNFTWFFPIDRKVDNDLINGLRDKIKNKRPTSYICINIQGIDKNELQNFRYRPKLDYVSHKGILMGKINIYRLIEQNWKRVNSI